MSNFKYRGGDIMGRDDEELKVIRNNEIEAVTDEGYNKERLAKEFVEDDSRSEITVAGDNMIKLGERKSSEDRQSVVTLVESDLATDKREDIVKDLLWDRQAEIPDIKNLENKVEVRNVEGIMEPESTVIEDIEDEVELEDVPIKEVTRNRYELSHSSVSQRPQVVEEVEYAIGREDIEELKEISNNEELYEMLEKLGESLENREVEILDDDVLDSVFGDEKENFKKEVEIATVILLNAPLGEEQKEKLEKGIWNRLIECTKEEMMEINSPIKNYIDKNKSIELKIFLDKGVKYCESKEKLYNFSKILCEWGNEKGKQDKKDVNKSNKVLGLVKRLKKSKGIQMVNNIKTMDELMKFRDNCRNLVSMKVKSNMFGIRKSKNKDKERSI